MGPSTKSTCMLCWYMQHYPVQCLHIMVCNGMMILKCTPHAGCPIVCIVWQERTCIVHKACTNTCTFTNYFGHIQSHKVLHNPQSLLYFITWSGFPCRERDDRLSIRGWDYMPWAKRILIFYGEIYLSRSKMTAGWNVPQKLSFERDCCGMLRVLIGDMWEWALIMAFYRLGATIIWINVDSLNPDVNQI